MGLHIEAGLPRTAPEQQGIASSAILEFIEAMDDQVHEMHSFMLLRHGCVVAEGWWSPYRRDHAHLLFSLSKGFTATAVGLAMAEGYISIDDPVLSFFPDEARADVSEALAAMRVRHLLSMSTGHAVDTWSSMVERADGDWIKGFLSVPVRFTPGTHFLYNTGATYMLSAIVQKTTGMNLLAYLGPRLFEPLGIENARWQASPQGIAAGGIGLSLKTEDVARFGQLYLQQGMWEARQLLPPSWVEQATAVQMATGDPGDGDWAQGYGYHFWRCRHGAYRADGVFGQYCIVMPEQDAVLAITGGMDVFEMQQPLNLVWEILLPAMGDGALAEDAVSQQRLTEKLAQLQHQPVQGHAGSPIVAQVSGRLYQVDANTMQIETIALHFNEAGCTFTAKTAAGEEHICCGYGVWQPGRTALFTNQWVDERTPVTASGAWTAEETFTMVVRLYETPFFHTLVFHFSGDELMLELQINVSLDSLSPVLLTATGTSV